MRPDIVELRDMQSNEAVLAEIAARTDGRLLPPLDQRRRGGPVRSRDTFAIDQFTSDQRPVARAF